MSWLQFLRMIRKVNFDSMWKKNHNCDFQTSKIVISKNVNKRWRTLWHLETFFLGTLFMNKCLKDKSHGFRKKILSAEIWARLALPSWLSLCIHTPHCKSTLLGPIDLGGRPFLAILQPEKKCPGKLHRSASKAAAAFSSSYSWHDSSDYCRI